jgi:hypothetical protein
MSFLYKSASGKDVQHASHSSLDLFRFCRRKFKLNRIDGWRQKGNKASLEFGKCVEAAIQYFHENGLKPEDCTQEFKRLWLKWNEQELIYTDQEENWATLYVMGSEMTKLYEARLPSLPIRNPKFQLQYKKKVFPGSELADLEFMGYVDMLSTLEDGKRIVVDIKTAKSPLDLTPNLVALDPQLREYAWMSGIQDVAFLWFVKAKPNSFAHGDEVALLENSGNWKAGDTLTVFKYQKPIAADAEKEIAAVPEKILVGTPEAIKAIDEEFDKIEGKGSTALKNARLEELISSETLVWVPREAVTKMRLQWVAGKIPKPVLTEVGQRVGHEMVALKTSAEQNFYPQDGGVRFPNQSCTWCEQRGHCLGDKKLVSDMLVQIKTPDEPDWLAELEEEAA